MSILESDHVGAFCRHTHVAQNGAANGPLAGLTFGLKDIYDVAGHNTGFGNPDWLRTHAAAQTTATAVSVLLDAGAALVGKTHTEEMAFSLTGENAHYGTPVNVNAPGRVPGGSSSGSAAAVAAGLVAFAIGSDTGGSVRAPASFCGIYGIRPTHGRISLEGVRPLAPSFDTCGWFASSAALLKQVGDVLLSARAKSAGRLLFAEDAFSLAVPAAAAALEPAVRRVRALFGSMEPVVVSPEGLHRWFDVFRVLQYGEIWDTHGAWVQRENPHFGTAIKGRFEAVAANDSERIEPMRVERDKICARLHELLANNAVLLVPTVPDIAPRLQAPPEETVAFREGALPLLCIAGLAGLPQVSLPLATLAGCPLGLSLIAARGNDEMLLELARAIGP